MNKKTILYIGGFELPDRNAAAQRVITNAKVFRRLGYEVFLVGLSDKATNTIERYEGFSYINYPYPKGLKDWFLYLTSIKQYFQYLSKDTCIIVAYNYPALALNKFRKWTFKKKIALIADCTEWYESRGNLLFRLIKDLDTSYRMKKVHPKLDGMIAISRFLYTYYFNKMNNVIEVPPLVDLSMDKWQHTMYKENYKNNTIEIVYAGSPGQGGKDRLDSILTILSQIKKEKEQLNFVFKVIGLSEQQYNNLFKKEIPFNLKKNVIFKGRLSHRDSLNEIKKAHFSFFIRDNNLTNQAGFPTKFVESISVGTPVLANITSNIENFMLNGKTGFLFDIHTLKYGLINAFSQTNEQIILMKDFCFNSRIFDYEKYIPQFDKLLNKLPNANKKKYYN